MANSIAAPIHINQEAEWQRKTVDAGPRCGYLARCRSEFIVAAMKCFARLIAVCAIAIHSLQAQSASRVSQLSAPKDVRMPDFTISNPNANKSAAIACSANGRLLAVAFEDAIRIYDVRQGNPPDTKLTRTLADSSLIHALILRGSNTLVSLAADGSVKTWDANSGKLLHRTSLNSGGFTVSAFAMGNQSLLATGTRDRVTLWNYGSGKSLNAFQTTDSTVSALAFTPDGKLLVVGTHKGVVRVFDIRTRTITRTIDLDSPICALSASMNYIVLGYSDGTLAQLSFQGETSTHEVSGHNDAVTAVAFSPQEERFASGSADGTIKIWNQSLKLLATLKGSAATFAITVSADGRTLATSSTNGLIEGWHLPAIP